MKFKNILFFTSILFVYSSYGQTKWTITRGMFRVEIFSDSILFGGSTGRYGRVVKKIEIRHVKNDTLIQTIDPPEFIYESYLDSNLVVKFEDVNFDGYQDIRLVNWVSTSLYTTYWYWIYDKQSKSFGQNNILEKIMNPQFDPDKKCIYTYWRVGLTENGHALYKWDGNKLSLLIEQCQYWGVGVQESGLFVTKRLSGTWIIQNEKKIYQPITLTRDELYKKYWKEK